MSDPKSVVEYILCCDESGEVSNAVPALARNIIISNFFQAGASTKSNTSTILEARMCTMTSALTYTTGSRHLLVTLTKTGMMLRPTITNITNRRRPFLLSYVGQ